MMQIVIGWLQMASFREGITSVFWMEKHGVLYEAPEMCVLKMKESRGSGFWVT